MVVPLESRCFKSAQPNVQADGYRRRLTRCYAISTIGEKDVKTYVKISKKYQNIKCFSVLIFILCILRIYNYNFRNLWECKICGSYFEICHYIFVAIIMVVADNWSRNR